MQKKFAYPAGWLLAGLLNLVVQALAFTGRVAHSLVRPMVAMLAAKVKAKQPSRPALKREAAALQVMLPEQHVQPDTGPATIIYDAPFDVADRIVSIRLEPEGVAVAVGVIHLRVYNALALVRRDLIVSEPQLAALMRGRRHNLPELAYDPVEGLEAIKEATIRDVENLINNLGKRQVRAARPKKNEVKQKLSQPAVPVPAAPQLAQAALAMQTPGADQHVVGAGQEAPVQQQRRSVPAAQLQGSGIKYVGQLVKAGTATRHPRGRPAYEVFEAKLGLDNGAELPLSGAELERELVAANVKIGERIAITALGKVAVTLASGEEGMKNLYRVERLK